MRDPSLLGRRRFLRAAGVPVLAALGGCSSLPLGNDGDESATARAVSLSDFRGSGPLVESRPELSGPRIEDLPDLSGELTLYLGGGEGGLYLDLISLLESIYPDFEVKHRLEPSSDLAQRLVDEVDAGNSPADAFLAVDAGSLGYVADNDAAASLPDDVVSPVPADFRGANREWVGVAGRARSVPYNTNAFSASDLPDDVFAFARDDRFSDAMGWAPTYGAFQSFVTAMRLTEGPERTKQWLTGMQERNVSRYRDEWFVSNAVADGEVGAGFANHYYALRVQASRPDAPLDLAFTKNDAGALVNVSGVEVVKGTDDEKLATDFVRHLLSVEAQEFFATRTFAYPMIPGVPPVGGLPSIDELAPPDVDLRKLSDLEPTLDLMREVGVL